MAEYSLQYKLDPALVKAFNSVVDLAFESGRAGIYEAQEEIHTAVRKLGMRLLGSKGLLDEVMNWLGDNPACGDVFAALRELYDRGDLYLEGAVLAQVRRNSRTYH